MNKPKDNGRESKPGDRGDASCASGVAGIKSGYSGTLAGECSKGYKPVNSGWAGNVKR